MYIIIEDHTILNQRNLRYYIKNKLTNNMVTFQTWPKIAILSAAFVLLMSATAAVEFLIL
jgi:hypothetical protein